MDELKIIPKEGIGIIKFGMSKQEAEQCIEYYDRKYRKPSYEKSYFTSGFRIEYDNNKKVNGIEVISYLKEDFFCNYDGIDLFNKKVKEILPLLEKKSSYDVQFEFYYFNDIGLRLWREWKFEEEDLESEWFKKLTPDQQEDEIKKMYFDAVGLYI